MAFIESKKVRGQLPSEYACGEIMISGSKNASYAQAYAYGGTNIFTYGGQANGSFTPTKNTTYYVTATATKSGIYRVMTSKSRRGANDTNVPTATQISIDNGNYTTITSGSYNVTSKVAIRVSFKTVGETGSGYSCQSAFLQYLGENY